MRLLLDTEVLLWWLADSAEMPNVTKTLIGVADMVYVSAASAWEIEEMQQQGRLSLPGDLNEAIQACDFTPLAISIEHAQRAARMQAQHDNLFDRLLLAQAACEELRLVTHDMKLKQQTEVAVVHC